LEVVMREQTTPRRTKVEGHRGIYWRPGPGRSKVYEVVYSDETGRQRWKTIEGGVRDAVAFREDVRSKRRRGERVSPSRTTLAEAAEAWLAGQANLRPGTLALYRTNLTKHVLPRLGRRRLASISPDAVAALIADMTRAGYSPYTVKGVLSPLSRILGRAARAGEIPSNPVARLERGERPRLPDSEMRVLDTGEVERLLGAVEGLRDRALIATAVFTGLRKGELRGLRWGDVNFDAGEIHVRRQADRRGAEAETKTRRARRTVALMPALGRLLREHRLASPLSSDEHPVFASEAGTPLDSRNIDRRVFGPAVKRAGWTSHGCGSTTYGTRSRRS
jgi:integrase